MVFLAVESPRLIQMYMDQNAEKKMDGFELEAQTYEQRYTSFSEEMKLLANDKNWENTQLVPVTDNKEQISDDQLTSAVNLELNHMIGLPEFAEKLVVSSKQLSKRERYSLYSQNSENKLNGLEVWSLEYVTGEQTIKAVLDVNFQKIYMMKIQRSNVSIFDYVDWDLESYMMNQTNGYYAALKEEENESPLIVCFPLKELAYTASTSDMYSVDKKVDKIDEAKTAVKEIGAADFGVPEDSSLLVYYDYAILEKDEFEIQYGIYHFRKMLQL